MQQTSVVPPILEARHVSRRNPSGPNWLLEDVSLVLEAGMRLALAGPSGSGKTLLLRAFALLDPLDQGEILWQGQPVHRHQVPGFRRQVMYLHQRAALLEANVAAALRRPFTLRVHRDRQYARARAIELLAALGREDSFLEKQVADLSGGEIQVTSLVRALLLEPTVLLLDEPTSALDPATSAAVEALIAKWTGEVTGRALIWVTHDADQARRIGNAIVYLQDGRRVDVT